jgi:urea transporter
MTYPTSYILKTWKVPLISSPFILATLGLFNLDHKTQQIRFFPDDCKFNPYPAIVENMVSS